jgi:antitoxin ParD1/3/4
MAANYTIGEHFEAMVEGLVESGRYKSADEVVQAGLRLVEAREQEREAKLEALRAAIQEGIDSGPAEEFDPKTLVEDIKKRGRERLAAEKLAAKANG